MIGIPFFYSRSFKGNSRIPVPESPSWKEGGRLGARRKGRNGAMEALGNPFTFMSQLELKGRKGRLKGCSYNYLFRVLM